MVMFSDGSHLTAAANQIDPDPGLCVIDELEGEADPAGPQVAFPCPKGIPEWITTTGETGSLSGRRRSPACVVHFA